MARWVRKRTPGKVAADRAADKAEARGVLANPSKTDLMRHHSPRKIAAARARGESNTRTPREAARANYRQSQLARAVGDRYPTGELHRHHARKVAKSAKTTASGGKWTLREANVTRDKSTGQFRRR